MKKLLIIPAVLLLASCGSNGGATGLSTSAPESTSGQSTSKTTPVGPTVTDITLNVTVSGIDTYEEGHSHIWINCDALGTSTEWGSEVLVQDTTDANKWSIIFEDFELEQSITYNLYYGTETSPDWTNGKNISESENLTLVTEEGKTSYDLAAEFYVPSSTGQIDLKFSVSALIMETADDTGKNISEGNYIWAWNNLDNTTVKLEKDTDDSWYFAKEDVDLLDGKVTVQITCVIGSAYAANWDYQQGAWESGTWVKYTSGISFEFTETETTHLENIYFQGEPEPVTGPTLTVYMREDSTSEFWPSSRWIEYGTTEYVLGEGAWIVDLAWNNEYELYEAVYAFSSDEVYLNVSVWTDKELCIGNEEGKPFHITFTAAEANIGLTVTYSGTDTTEAVVTQAVGCTIE